MPSIPNKRDDSQECHDGKSVEAALKSETDAHRDRPPMRREKLRCKVRAIGEEGRSRHLRRQDLPGIGACDGALRP